MYTTAVTVAILLLATTACVRATQDDYVIPVAINPIMQEMIHLSDSGMVQLLYQLDIPFYSKVTLADLATNTGNELKELILKKVSVVFLILSSSYIGETLTFADLRHIQPSQWSYTVRVKDMLTASNGTITEFTETTKLYKLQELAMKVLEKRYGFSMSGVQSYLGLAESEFLGPTENQWIDIVGVIAKHVAEDRSEAMNLTPCYLALLLNRTHQELEAFTLNDVDQYLYNTSTLVNDLPAFRNKMVAEFNTAFNITTQDLANMINVNISLLESSGVKDYIQHYVDLILGDFHLSSTTLAQKYSQVDIVTPCPENWDAFKVLVSEEAFAYQAADMSVTIETLAMLMQTSYNAVKGFSFTKMKSCIANEIEPIKSDKNKIEQTTLNALEAINGLQSVNKTEENAFILISSVTKLTKYHLTLLYHFTEADYKFAELFSITELIESCSDRIYNQTILTLAKLNVGMFSEAFLCKCLPVMRAIWNNATLRQLEETFIGGQSIASEKSLEDTIAVLMNASSTFIFRVLGTTTSGQDLCSSVSLHQLSLVTSHTVSQLKEMSLGQIIGLAEYLKSNGSLYPQSSPTSSTSPSTVFMESNSLTPTQTYISTSQESSLKSATETLMDIGTINTTRTVSRSHVEAIPSSSWKSDMANNSIPNIPTNKVGARSSSARACFTELVIWITILVMAALQ